MLCAPFAQAMNSLLPKARPLAQMLMNPRVRSALITQGQAVAHAAAPQTQRGFMTLAQTTARPTNQWLLSGPNLTRQLSTTTRQQAATSMKSLALKAGVVGLAYAASPATVAYAEGYYSSLIANGMTALVGALGLYGIITGYPDITLELLVSKNPIDIQRVLGSICKNPDYARQLAELVTADNIINIDMEILSYLVGYSPEAAKNFVPYVIQNIESLISTLEGRWFLIAIIYKNPEAAKDFTPYVAHNIGSLMSDWQELWFLKKIMDQNPQAVKDFTSYAAGHIASVAKGFWGNALLQDIMNRNPEAAKEFTLQAVKHIESLVKDSHGLALLKEVMKRNPEAVKELTFHVVKHCESLMMDAHGLAFLKEVMKRNPESVKEFTPYVEAYIEWLVRSEVGMRFLLEMMNNNPQLSVSFSLYAAQNFGSMVNHASGRAILVSMANANATVKPALIAELKKYMGDKSDLSSALTWEGMFYRLLNSESLTPTEFGLLYAAKEISKHKKQTLEDPNIKKVVDTVIELEKKYEPTHYTFTHGRNRAYECVSTVYGGLWKYAYNTPVPEDFIFTHTKDVHDPLMHKVKLHEERKLHEANIKERANIAGEIRNRRLFLNTQLFGNMGTRGSSSFSYFLRSANASGQQVKIGVKDIFAQFGQQVLYEKYKGEFEALEKEHKALSEQGEILVVAVPKDRVNQDVTCMNVYGDPAPQYMINGKMTNNVQEILEARKKDPSIGDNELNFTLAMTDTAALDPKSGIKFHSVQKIDEKKYAAWQGKLDALMAKIEAEFKASWKQSLKAKERGHRDLLDAVRATQKYMSAKE